MFVPRIIPVLLLKDLGLVKSVKFKKHKYIGDPINAVKIFNDNKADELIFLDIMASKNNSLISKDFIKKVGDQANMPFGVGGGIRTIDDIKIAINNGAEKVVLNTIALDNPTFIKEASDSFGSSTITVCIDVKKNLFNKYKLFSKSGTVKSKLNFFEFVEMMEYHGAGELIIQSIDRDGTFSGYDLELIKTVSKKVTIPVIALGGSSCNNDFQLAIENHASAVAAGSLFVYHGPRKAVLINYPNLKIHLD